MVHCGGLSITPLSGTLGASITGINLADGISDDQFAAIRHAFFDRGVIVFPEQHLEPEQHLSFAKRWGGINVNRFFAAVDGHPEIAEVRKEPDQTENIGDLWHTDHSYDLAPAMGSILNVRVLPEFGGDTLFASMYKAYDALSDGMKAMLSSLNAWHSSRHVFGPEAADESTHTGRIGNAAAATQDALHPIVITHPGSGRQALYVNPQFTTHIDGWNSDESAALLQFLYQHAANPHFTTRVSWQPGMIGMWDNRAVWHCALNDYHGQRRLMHRVTIEGVPLNTP